MIKLIKKILRENLLTNKSQQIWTFSSFEILCENSKNDRTVKAIIPNKKEPNEHMKLSKEKK